MRIVLQKYNFSILENYRFPLMGVYTDFWISINYFEKGLRLILRIVLQKNKFSILEKNRLPFPVLHTLNYFEKGLRLILKIVLQKNKFSILEKTVYR